MITEPWAEIPVISPPEPRYVFPNDLCTRQAFRLLLASDLVKEKAAGARQLTPAAQELD
jgi:hypothetical protein